MLLLDNIIFELQKAGGVSLVWQAILNACISEPELSYRILDSGYGKENIFYPKNINHEHLITDNGPLLLRRYLDVKKSIPAKVFHSSYFRTHKNKSVKNIVTVHDFVYEKFDSGLRRHIHLLQKKHALNSADVIICVSENTKEDLLTYHPNLANKEIRVIHNGVGEDFALIANKHSIQEKHAPYIFYVGGRYAHKNFSCALALLNTSIAKKIGLTLKVAGGGGFSLEELKEISQLKLSNKVFHVGQINNQTLNELYNFAYAFIYPSLYEGFGIPPLEAMAAGCPVICSNTSSIPEVVADAGLLFNPYKIDEAEQLLINIQDVDYRNKIISNGLIHAAKFSWQKTGKNTVDLYKELL